MTRDALPALDRFVHRHLGSNAESRGQMLAALGCEDMDALLRQAIPASIRTRRPLDIGPERGEHELLAELRAMASENRVFRSFIGAGYSKSITPAVIARNVLENPGWYTPYTPYQSEISQGRLEGLLNFQTVVSDLTALPLANASLLDEATACAEAMAMCHAVDRSKRNRFFVADDIHPQNLAVLQTRAKPLKIEILRGRWEDFDAASAGCFGALLQYPSTDGRVPAAKTLQSFCERARASSTLVVAACDLMALTLLRAPGEWGADVAVGNSQRFGVPLGYGGPHAAFLATREEYKRQMPGRMIGVSVDSHGEPAYRLAMQTREQHIRRDKATSNICTAQALLANMASMYAVYHGPDGLRAIAEHIHRATRILAAGLAELGFELRYDRFFDSVRVGGADPSAVRAASEAAAVNLRYYADGDIGIALDEATTAAEVEQLLGFFAAGKKAPGVPALAERLDGDAFGDARRSSGYLKHERFHRYRSEHEMLRYLHRLQAKDLSLTTSMIPLGSCTMKLNGSSEMLPMSWPEFADLHPFAPVEQAAGYAKLFTQLEAWLCDITGFAATSLQPNAGSQGEYAGLLAIHAYHESRGDSSRDICLIPVSAHGTNPASAVMAGFRVVGVKCDDQGNIDLDDLRAKSQQHAERLGALMITYPSTHGVFEESIHEICSIVHEHGGQVYMDGANMNAQVGLCRPAELGADVCHLNLHKTFCIPHGGGGPGMGPIAVAEHLAEHLPDSRLPGSEGARSVGYVSAAPYGSPSILPISWVYIALMGSDGLRQASELAILNANYMAERLKGH
ncbi:MAG TPA: aminomethyl-transferring glycine dehydrogenase, partial [Candidatus Krumholzibacteria bacterium]